MKKKLLFVMLVVMLLPIIPKSNELFSTDSRIKWKKDSTGISFFKIHPNGNIIGYNYSDVRLLELDPNNGDTVRLYGGDHFPNYPFVISSDGNYIIDYFQDTITIINYQTQAITKIHKNTNLLSILSDSRRIICRWTNLSIYDFISDTTYIIPFKGNLQDLQASPYGNFIVTMEKGKDIPTQKENTSLVLRNANTFEFISNLETIVDDVRYSQVHFSPDNKYVGLNEGGMNTGFAKFKVFSLDSFGLVKEINQRTLSVPGFNLWCFIDSANISYSSSTYNSQTNVNFSYVQVRNIFSDQILLDYHVSCASNPGIGYCPNNRTLICNLGEDLYGFSWDSILSDVPEPLMTQRHSAEYNKNTLQINGTFDVSLPVDMVISDINGNLIKKQNIQYFESDSKYNIPLNLPTGTYFIRVKNGKNEFSDKFIVVN